MTSERVVIDRTIATVALHSYPFGTACLLLKRWSFDRHRLIHCFEGAVMSLPLGTKQDIAARLFYA